MTSEELLMAISEVDDDLVAELEEARHAKVTRIRPGFYIGLASSMCAVLLALIGIKALINYRYSPNVEIQITEIESVNPLVESALTAETEDDVTHAYAQAGTDPVNRPETITVGDKRYKLCDSSIRKKYGLPEEGYRVDPKKDLGEHIGEVTYCRNPDIIGCKVFARPDASGDDPILILFYKELQGSQGYYEYYFLSFDGNAFTNDYCSVYEGS